ncbi:MAG: DNA-protecting protein DprA [Rhodospirillaceae bacterium]|nr:DNA-protecting protein DprA [Rhodospirillaceae bacterium]
MLPRQLTLDARERLDWLRLTRTDHVGPITFFQLLRRFGSAGAALAALPDLAKRGGRRATIKLYPARDAEAEIEACRKQGVTLVAWAEPDYPAPLAAVEDAPPLVMLRGAAALLSRPIVAIVGARNASANGVRFARQLAADLGRAGLIVVSGLARGIDTGAHEGAFSTGTVAVMAGGVDVPYPPENAALLARIAASGAALSELPLGTTPVARHFPRRNRIISGLAAGVVVVEASLHSGSLITARMALEQGREVLAVPGSPLDPRCRGSNDLIRKGATLVESAEDVMNALGAIAAPSRIVPEGRPDPSAAARAPGEDSMAEARELILSKLSPTPTPVDEIIRQCQLSPTVVSGVFLELELAGRLARHLGNQVSLIEIN